jgi:hypothetical protein
MIRRVIAPVRVASCLLVATSFLSVRVTGQAPVAAGKTPTVRGTEAYTPSRTPWGDPDIQGVYKNVSMFPLEARERLTVEGEPSGPRRADAGAGPEHWYEVPMNGTTPMVVDPPNRRVPYKPWAQALNAEINKHQGDNPEVKIKREYLDHRVRCLPSGTPRVTTPCAYCGYQIMQGPGFVAFFYEWNHLYQYIPLDGRPHQDPSIKLWMGDAVGHWEGNTLVVDVTNMNDKTWVARGAAIHSSAMHAVERYTPIDKDTINYEVRIEDPNVFTQPWKMQFPAFARYPADTELYEYACAEGNHIDETVFGAADKKQDQ